MKASLAMKDNSLVTKDRLAMKRGLARKNSLAMKDGLITEDSGHDRWPDQEGQRPGYEGHEGQAGHRGHWPGHSGWAAEQRQERGSPSAPHAHSPPGLWHLTAREGLGGWLTSSVTRVFRAKPSHPRAPPCQAGEERGRRWGSARGQRTLSGTLQRTFPLVPGNSHSRFPQNKG